MGVGEVRAARSSAVPLTGSQGSGAGGQEHEAPLADALDRGVVVARDVEIALDLERVYRAQGIKTGLASPAVVAATDALLPEARRLLQPAFCCRVLTVERVERKQVTFVEGPGFHGRLPTVLFGCGAYVFAAVCTAGSALDRRIVELAAAGDLVEAFILDAIGTATVSGVQDVARALACIWAARRGLKAGVVARPANRSWPLADQKVFAATLPLDEIGVELTDTLLFRPSKTASLGIALGEQVVEGEQCDYCAAKARCQFRCL